VNLKGEFVQVLVPFADFANYNPNFNLQFDYTPLHDGGFYMQAAFDIQKGEELTYNYGRWSNKYFFMNFGFALP
jgi:histone-lysine N-methyltransferase SETD3